MIAIRVFFLSLLLALGACQKEESVQIDPNVDPSELETSIHRYQWDLFESVVNDRAEDENILVSPLSIATALYMTLNGARDATKEAMESALSLQSMDREVLDQMYKKLMVILEDSDNNTRLTQANAIFYDKSRMTVADDFSDLMRTYFDAGIFDLIFSDESTLPAINGWVNDNTEGRIEKIIEEIDPVEVMFLINALYFQADWNLPFAEEATNEQIFSKADGSTTEVPMMYMDDALSFYDGEDFQAAELFFADTNYSMTFLLPPSGQSVRSFTASLDADRLGKLHEEEMIKGRIILHLPRFEVAYKIVLNQALKSMGMGLAFDRNQANLSGLGNAPEGNLFVNRVNHKTFLKIDEKGAEGAAVTSVGIGVTSLPPVLRFNRPFAYLLRHRSTGVIVFMGILDDPASA